MKLLSFVLAMTLTVPAFAGVKEDVAALGALAFGHSATPVKGKTAEELFKDLYQDDEELVYKEAKDMEWSDEVEEGFTSIKSAIEMGTFAEGVYEEQMENSEGAELSKLKKELAALKREWATLITKLGKQGVKFGYTGHGPGYCGVSFIELILVDEKAHTVYEVYLSQGGQC
jgi:hypothetical protein